MTRPTTYVHVGGKAGLRGRVKDPSLCLVHRCRKPTTETGFCARHEGRLQIKNFREEGISGLSYIGLGFSIGRKLEEY